jgi:hypothetical protein
VLNSRTSASRAHPVLFWSHPQNRFLFQGSPLALPSLYCGRGPPVPAALESLACWVFSYRLHSLTGDQHPPPGPFAHRHLELHNGVSALGPKCLPTRRLFPRRLVAPTAERGPWHQSGWSWPREGVVEDTQQAPGAQNWRRQLAVISL